MRSDTGDFEIQHAGQSTFSVTAQGNVEILGKLNAKGAVRIDGPLDYLGTRQWALAHAEDFQNVSNQ